MAAADIPLLFCLEAGRLTTTLVTSSLAALTEPLLEVVLELVEVTLPTYVVSSFLWAAAIFSRAESRPLRADPAPLEASTDPDTWRDLLTSSVDWRLRPVLMLNLPPLETTVS